MRILFANAYFDKAAYEGSRVHLERLSSELSRLGHEIWVTAGSPLQTDGRLTQESWRWRLELLGMDALYMRVEGHNPSPLPLYAEQLLLRRAARIPLVWEVNSASDLAMLFSGGSSSRVKELDEVLRKRVSLVQLAICNTPGLSRYMGDLGVKTRRVIPLGSDPRHFCPTVVPSSEIKSDGAITRVVWCGNGSAGWHDLDVVRRAALRLADRPDIRLYIVGEAPPGLVFPANVTSLGRRDYCEMPGLLGAMDMGLATYREPDWSRYGVFSSPLKLFDYFASGIPVLGSPIEQVVECLADGRAGTVVDFGDDARLADEIQSLALHPDVRAAKGRHARSLAERVYNWGRVARDTANAIAAVRTPLLATRGRTVQEASDG